METLRILAVLLPLGLSSGINLYATVLVVGLCIRFGLVSNPPAGLAPLGTWPVIVVAGLMYTVEFLADKVQFVDNAWDLIHTFIRPAGAAILALTALGKTDPALLVIGALISGGAALAAHASKAGTRVAVNVVSPAENVSNIGLSVGEDVLAGGMAYLALQNPLLAGGLAVVLLIIMILVVPQILRWTWFVLRGVGAWVRGVGHRGVESDLLPPGQAALLGTEVPEMVGRARTQGIRGAGGRDGFLVLTATRLYFTYDTRSGAGKWSVDRSQIRDVRYDRRLLMDWLILRCPDARGRLTSVRFAFLKDRGALAEQVARRLAGLPAPTMPQTVLPVQSP